MSDTGASASSSMFPLDKLHLVFLLSELKLISVQPYTNLIDSFLVIDERSTDMGLAYFVLSIGLYWSAKDSDDCFFSVGG